MEWMLMPYRRYAEFSGRSRRKEYWMFYLLIVIFLTVLSVIMSMGAPTVDPLTGQVSGGGMMTTVGGGLLLLFGVGTIIPSLAVSIRRMHDQDKSGWFLLLALIPLLGGLVVLVFMCLEGTKGPNRFGPDPKGEADPATFA